MADAAGALDTPSVGETPDTPVQPGGPHGPAAPRRQLSHSPSSNDSGLLQDGSAQRGESLKWFVGQLELRGGRAKLSELGDTLRRLHADEFRSLQLELGGRRRWVQNLAKCGCVRVSGDPECLFAELEGTEPDAAQPRAPSPTRRTTMCEICQVPVCPGDFQTHERGRKHQRKLAEVRGARRADGGDVGADGSASPHQSSPSPTPSDPRRLTDLRPSLGTTSQLSAGSSAQRSVTRLGYNSLQPPSTASEVPPFTQPAVVEPVRPQPQEASPPHRFRHASDDTEFGAEAATDSAGFWCSMKLLLPLLMSLTSVCIIALITVLMLYNTSAAVDEMMAQTEAQLIHGTLAFVESQLMRMLEINNGTARYLSKVLTDTPLPGPRNALLGHYMEVNGELLRRVATTGIVANHFFFHPNGRVMGIVTDWTKTAEDITYSRGVYWYVEEEVDTGCNHYRVPVDDFRPFDMEQDWELVDETTGRSAGPVQYISRSILNRVTGEPLIEGDFAYNESGNLELQDTLTGTFLAPSADGTGVELVPPGNPSVGRWTQRIRYGAGEYMVLMDYVGAERPYFKGVNHRVAFDWTWYGPFNVDNWMLYAVTSTVHDLNGRFVGVIGTDTFVHGFIATLRELKEKARLPVEAELFLVSEGPRAGLVAASAGEVMICGCGDGVRDDDPAASGRCAYEGTPRHARARPIGACRPRPLRLSTSPVIAAAGEHLEQGSFVLDGQRYRVATGRYDSNRLSLLAGAVLPDAPYVEKVNRGTVRTLLTAVCIAAAGVYGIVRLCAFFAAALEHLASDLDRFSRLDFAPRKDAPKGLQLTELAKARAACLRVRRAVEAFSLYVPAGERERLPEGLRISDTLLPQPWVPIGVGSFGRVYRARFKRTASDVAVKELLPRSASESPAEALARRGRFLEEMRNLERLRVNFIVMFYGWTRGQGGSICMVTEYCAGGTLRQLAEKQMPAPARAGMAIEAGKAVARALLYLHSRGEVHMDVAARNVLVTAAREYKLADLGALCMVGAVAPTVSVAWSPPESLTPDRVARPEHDVWSYGCMLYEVLSGESPWWHLAPSESRLGVTTAVTTVADRVAAGRWIKAAERAVLTHQIHPAPACCDAADGGRCRALWKAVAVACCERSLSRRPGMSKVIELLDAAAAETDARSVGGTEPEPIPPLCDEDDDADRVAVQSSRGHGGTTGGSTRSPSVHGEVVGSPAKLSPRAAMFSDPRLGQSDVWQPGSWRDGAATAPIVA
eukprot:TRINITY_DN13324_c1_g1_i1.p1 TRINITY_DN13324_c1_g1~~TRINITY_DN13324_c1_g1_i1.p1  ORF type:complete len:1263 (+),score=401.21 TRINITY_DN13324_c1_g1_i1:54-3791(+)